MINKLDQQANARGFGERIVPQLMEKIWIIAGDGEWRQIEKGALYHDGKFWRCGKCEEIKNVEYNCVDGKCEVTIPPLVKKPRRRRRRQMRTPPGKCLEAYTKAELLVKARKKEIPGRSKMNKQQLKNALRKK